MGDIMKKDMDKLDKQIEALSNIVKKDDREVTEMKKKELIDKVKRATTDDNIEKTEISKAKKGGSRKTTTKKKKNTNSNSNIKKTEISKAKKTKQAPRKTTKKKGSTKKLDKEVKDIINDLEETKTLNAISDVDTSLVNKTVNDLEEEIRNLYDDNTIVMKPVEEKGFLKKKNNIEENTKFTKIGPSTTGSAVLDKIDGVDEKVFSTLTKILFVIFMIMFIGVCAMIFYITIA